MPTYSVSFPITRTTYHSVMIEAPNEKDAIEQVYDDFKEVADGDTECFEAELIE